MTCSIRARLALVLAVLMLPFAAFVSNSSAQVLTDSTVVPIEGVTVTSSRAPETVLRAPAAITVVGKQQLERTRQLSLADGLNGIPGVFTQSRAGAQDVRITIRGFGARGSGERSNSGTMRGIRVLTDGVPLTEPDGRTSLEFIDLGGSDRVEVLRSNGSALYGNAAGGVVNLRTTHNFERSFLEVSQRAGGYGFMRSQAVAGYTLGEARGTTSVYTSKFDGWRKHSENATTSIQNRLSAPLDAHTRLGVLLDFVSNFSRFPGALTQAQLDASPAQANPVFVSRDERRFNRVGRAAVTLEQDVKGAHRWSFATWVEPKVLQRSERNRFRDFNRYHAGGNATVQFETAVAEGWRGVWSAGADEQYQDGTIQFYNLDPGGVRSTTVFANKREGANSAGGFVQAELRNGDWSFRVSGRYDNLWYISEDRVTPSLSASKHFTQLTPKGSIARTFEHHTVYASVGGTVEAPAFNEIDPPPPFDATTSLNPFLDPMRSTSYELGVKGSLMSESSGIGHLGYEAAYYLIHVVNDIIPYDGGGTFLTAGKSRRQGAELGLNWAPMSKLAIRAAATMSKNKYLKYTNDLGTFDDNEVAGLPAAFVDGSIRYQLVDGLSIAGTLKHVGRYYADDANLARTKASTIFGAEAEYGRVTPFGRMSVFVAGENLGDENYVASVFINGVRGEFYEPGLPASVSAGVTISLR